MLPPSVFLHTAFALALANPKDRLHERAIDLADQLEAARTQLITTRAVLLEIGNSLAKVRYRAAGVQLLTSLETDPNVEIVSIQAGLCHTFVQFVKSRQKKYVDAHHVPALWTNHQQLLRL